MSRVGSPAGLSSDVITDIDDVSSNTDKFETNNVIKASATLTYLGKEKSDGEWQFLKLDSTSGLVKRYATVVNNPTITSYADALTNYLTLTYTIYSESK